MTEGRDQAASAHPESGRAGKHRRIRDNWATIDPPGVTRPFYPLVNLVARIPASIHAKLLASFLIGALLLLGLGLLNSLVIDSMSQHVKKISQLEEKLDLARQMEYLITAQSHYRAMALLTRDDGNNEKIAAAKKAFLDHLSAVENLSSPEDASFFETVRAVNAQYAASGARILALYRSGNIPEALRRHIAEEHPISHELEAAMRTLEQDAFTEIAAARSAYASDRSLLRLMVLLFSGASIATALLLGFALSWSLIRPVRKIGRELAAISQGDFSGRVEIANRDEFGALGAGVNTMAERLAGLYGQLSRVSENLQTVIDNAKDGIITADENGTIESFSPAAERIFGYRADEVIGQGADLLTPETAAPGASHWRPAQVASTTSNQAVMGRHKDGTLFPLDLAVSEVHTADKHGVVGIVRDITERVRVQEQLALARDQALEANRAKSTFLANMSHELRTPLNAIIGYSEMLEEEAEESDQQDLVADLRKIHGAGKHLLELINALLDLSKIEAGKMELFLESFDIVEMVHDVVSVVQPLIDKNANRLQVELESDLGTMRADLTKVRQALFNLLSNAAKFTQEGLVTLRVSRHAEGAGEIRFQVTDTGIGMTEEQLGRLFQEFSQANAFITRTYGGTGLGLALSRHLCRMMGGDIEVESRPGKGSTFTIRLPAEAGAVIDRPQGQDGAGSAPISSHARSVLVIDDDPAVRELMQRSLGREGYRTLTAADGEEGLRLAREERPDLITLDVIMPRTDGWTVLSTLKADRDLADIPVIMITVTDDRNAGYALGAADYLTKPVDRERVLALVRKHCEPNSGTILVVEDDEVARTMLVRMLAGEGFSPYEASNGMQALARLAEVRPDLILLDLMMPEMDGFELLLELRKREDWRSIPVVVVTAKDLTQEDHQRLNGYVRLVVQKGAYSREELIEEVRHLLAGEAQDRTQTRTTA